MMMLLKRAFRLFVIQKVARKGYKAYNKNR